MSLTKFGKKMLCFVSLFALVFALFSCNPTVKPGEKTDKEIKKEAAEEQTGIVYDQILWDESAMKDISTNLVLTTTTRYATTTVAWASTHPDIINPETGKVTTPNPDHEDATLVDQSKPGIF